jgi:sugar-specific transcriptional regulator TrmB
MEIIEELQSLGLTRCQSHALAAVMAQPGITALEISEKTGVSYTKMYDILETLRAMNFIKTTLERPKRFFAIDPEFIVSFLVKRQEDTVELLKSRSQKALTMLNQVKPQAMFDATG